MLKRLLLLLALLLPAFGYITVSAAYQITPEQLTASEYNLNELATDNAKLTQQVKNSNNELTAAATALKESNNQIQAEESLNQYDKKDKAQNNRIKWLQIALAGVVVYAVTK